MQWYLYLQCRKHIAHDLGAYLMDVIDTRRKSLAPHHFVRADVDQLDDDRQPGAEYLNEPGNAVTHAERPTHGGKIDFAMPKTKRRAASDDS